MEPVSPAVKPAPVASIQSEMSEQPIIASKMGDAHNDIRNISEEDLIKLKKINFKKKVSGKKNSIDYHRDCWLIIFLTL